MKEVFIGFLGSIVLRLLNFTLRWQKIGLEVGGDNWAYAPPLIVAFWHSDQLLAPWSYLVESIESNGKTHGKKKRRPAAVLISEHSDGRIIASALRFLSIRNIPGSSTRGGLRALVKMKQTILEKEWHITITPDGPKGPVHQVKPGVIMLASQTGAPILPLGFAYSSAWRARSWDRMLVPKPFSKACVVGGELLRIPAQCSQEQVDTYCKQLESGLMKVKERAEKMVSSQEKSLSTLSQESNEGHNSQETNV